MLLLSTMRILTYYEVITYNNYSWAYLATFFLAMTIITFYILRFVKQKNAKKFLYAILILTGGKPILYATFILIYGLNNPSDVKNFTITFLVYFLIFTVYEVFMILKMNKGKIK